MLLLRLRGRKICDHLLRKGKVWKGKHMMIRWLPGHPRHPASKVGQSGIYVGSIASTKLDKSAVKRNRMRRRCREALRRVVKEHSSHQSPTFAFSEATVGRPVTSHSSPTFQLLIAPRSTSLWAPFPEIEADLRAFLRLPVHGSAAKE